ncbi:MAG TPA: BON domain-containing protein [Vicinamibacterales bacterium]|nr:BON domain-containing protein [Vicinamibacterales bacterium]
MLTVFTLGVSSAMAQMSTIKDGWLVMKVHSEFVNEDVLAGSNIDVDVKNGVVTLQGTVPSEAARARATELARKNDGVKNVVDQLKIAPARPDNRVGAITGRTADQAERAAERTADKTERAADRAADKTANATRSTGRAIDDGWIKSKIYAQYLTDWNTVLDDSNIDVDVDNNMVTLSGTVKTAEAKAKAVSIAKATDGVKGVKDNLRVVPAAK